MNEELLEIGNILKKFATIYDEDDQWVSYAKTIKITAKDLNTVKFQNFSKEFIGRSRRKEKIEEWVRKIEGIVSGYYEEFKISVKHCAKGRAVKFDRADVTVMTNTESFFGPAEGKAIQVKSTITTGQGAVNTMLAKGLNQLTGETGECPEVWERLQVRMVIKSNLNSWPHSTLKQRPFKEYVDIASTVICERVTKYRKKNAGCSSDWLKNNLTNIDGGYDLTHGFDKKSRLYDKKGKIEIRTIAVKIIYPRGSYLVTNIPLPNNSPCDGWLKKIVFVVVRDSRLTGGQVACSWHHALVVSQKYNKEHLINSFNWKEYLSSTKGMGILQKKW